MEIVFAAKVICLPSAAARDVPSELLTLMKGIVTSSCSPVVELPVITPS